jgi:2'-5' RNA ligase
VTELRSALVVAVPEAASAVDDWRERTCADRPSIGVPAHVTILFPFVPPPLIDRSVVEELRVLVGHFERFSFELRETRRFPGLLYLAPEPPGPFVQMIEAVTRRYPEYPPYGGSIDSIVPHVTVAHGDADLLDVVDSTLRPFLPIVAEASEVCLLEEVAPDWGRWQTHTRLPLGRGPS